METELEYDADNPPSEFICPISQDLMSHPVNIYHRGISYTFDKVCVKTWWKTEGGDKNPLTMLDGFKGLEMIANNQLLSKIREFKIATGQNPDMETEEVNLEPFSDYEQIQEDEELALRLHRDMNGIESLEPVSLDDRIENMFSNIFRLVPIINIDNSHTLNRQNDIINNNIMNNNIIDSNNNNIIIRTFVN